MEELTISEIAQRSGLRASAIRYYESIQLLPPPQRKGGRRWYTVEILRQISFIQVAQAAGFTIAGIQTLINELGENTQLSERWQVLARKKLVEVDALMRKVQGMQMILLNGLNCHCATLEDCMDCIIRAETHK
ncbi:MAG TPA: MerR family transcriptional regulator [Ktedonobacteraceae bacterium]